MNYSDLKEKLQSLPEDDFLSKADLHIHSKYSDGALSPEEIVKITKEKNYKLISITDHNTVSGYLKTNVLRNDFVIPGIEFDCWHKGVLVHILGYGIDIHNDHIKALCVRNKNCVKSFGLRFMFTTLSAKEAIKTIKEAGGVAVLAHPACYWAVSLETLFRELKEIGLDGVECYYIYIGFLKNLLKFHSEKLVIDLAEKYNFIKTGGSDNHSTTFDFEKYTF